MTPGRADAIAGLRSGRLQLLVPIIVALLAALAAALYPRADEPGSIRTGPVALSDLPRVVLPFAPTVLWGPAKRSVVLTVHPRRPCDVRLRSVTSTAPGRLEVALVSTGDHCVGPRRSIRFALPLPVLPDPHRNVRVLIGQEALRLAWARHPPPHPPGSYD